eukprot:3011047-Prymnesium_polylepis.1
MVLVLERASSGMLYRAHASIFCVGLRCRQRFGPRAASGMMPAAFFLVHGSRAWFSASGFIAGR